MTHEEIHKLVKNLEPLFIGYTANEDCLKNENGMVLLSRFFVNRTFDADI